MTVEWNHCNPSVWLSRTMLTASRKRAVLAVADAAAAAAVGGGGGGGGAAAAATKRIAVLGIET